MTQTDNEAKRKRSKCHRFTVFYRACYWEGFINGSKQKQNKTTPSLSFIIIIIIIIIIIFRSFQNIPKET